MSPVARASIVVGSLFLALACGGSGTPTTPVTSDAVAPADSVTAPPVEMPVAVAPTIGHTYAGPYASDFTGWAESSGPAGGFAIRMPGSTEDEKSPLDTPLGQAVTHTYGASSSTGPVGYFMVSTTDYPAGFVGILGTEAALDSARQGLITGSGGSLLDEQKTTTFGYSARRFRISATSQGVSLEMIGKMFIVNDRIYILAVSTVDNTANDWADGWLETFRLL